MIDCHTHNTLATDAIISMSPQQAIDFIPEHPDAMISVGIHPWASDQPVDLDLLDYVATMPQVVALGETGLDTLKGAPIQLQTDIFQHHIDLSQRLDLPLIIHCVKAWDLMMKIYKENRPANNWVIHGFRGKPQLARQLINMGLYLSLGEHFNAQSAALIPDDRLLVETDESTLPIEEIVARINACRPHHVPFDQNLRAFLTSKT